MKKIIAIILSLICMLSTSVFFAGCDKGNGNGKDTGNKYASIQQDEYLFGVCNLTSDQLPGIIDSKVNNEWSANKIGALGAKSTRLWIYMGYHITRDPNSNDLSLIKGNCDILHDYIAKMKANGVERFVGMITSFVTPYEFNCSDSTAVPSVYDDYDMYIKFLDVMSDAYTLLAKEFPEIKFWEIGNEPDISHGSWFHKKGYTENTANSYKFTPDEGAHISADLLWYARKAIRAVNPEAKIVCPGLTCSSYNDDSMQFLTYLYEKIKSGYLPTAEEYSDMDPDNYFDILAWHPYPPDSKKFIESNKKMYQVAIDNGDEGKPVFLTEFGFSDRRFGGDSAERDTEGTQKNIADLAVECLNIITKELPFVETAFMFRLSNVAEYYRTGSDENSFGLFYSPNDTDEWAGKPKPIATALYKYFNGENADTSILYK